MIGNKSGSKMDGRFIAFFFACVITSGAMLDASKAVAQNEADPYYGKRTSWEKVGEGDLNISSYAFRDVNRNGIYDLGDMPMAKIAFEMTRPDGTKTVVRSNVAGFANFRMSVRKRDCEIVDPGLYSFEAKIPPGWHVTSGKTIQKRTFRTLPGAPADLITDDPAEAVGLAPDLKISGRVAPVRAEDKAPKLLAKGSTGETREHEIGLDGTYTIPAVPGSWAIELEDPARGTKITRAVEVGRTPVLLSAIDLGRAEPEPAREKRTIGFDDLLKTEAVTEIPSGYGGLRWWNWVATHNKFYKGEGYLNGTVSGEYVAYNSSGHPAQIWNDVPFDFVGGYFSGAWLDAEGEKLTIRGWRGTELVYEDELELSALGPVYFAADYRRVTRLDFSTEHFWQFVCDDIGFRKLP